MLGSRSAVFAPSTNGTGVEGYRVHDDLMPIPRLARWTSSTAVVLVLAAGCTTTDPPPAAAAAEHYDEVRAELLEALSANDLSWHEQSNPVIATDEGRCIFDPGTWTADGLSFSHDEDSWRPLLEPVNDVLDKLGFRAVREFDRVAGQGFGIATTDEHDLQLRLFLFDDRTELQMHGADVSVPEECGPGALES